MEAEGRRATRAILSRREVRGLQSRSNPAVDLNCRDGKVYS